MTTLYAEWSDIEERIADAVESVLLDHDLTAGPRDRSEIEWAQETAKRVVSVAMMHLDGYPHDEEVARLKRLLAQRGKDAADAEDEVERLRQALIPFAFIGRGSMAPLGLAEEYDRARELLRLDASAREVKARRAM